jgi:IS1 family transposase
MANNISIGKKIIAVSMLCEGSSIRAVERVTGVHRDTIMRLGLRVGWECERIHNERMVQLGCRNVQVDELWGVIYKKQRYTTGRERAEGMGDVWTYIALDADTKVIPAYLVGRKGWDDASIFVRDLAKRMKYRIQLSSDGMNAYAEAVAENFRGGVDYGQIVKTFSVVNLTQPASGRYSPADVVMVEKKPMSGSPDFDRISTSHVEKQNHTLRMHCRRLTRLTNAFSKKLDNFKAAVALNFAYYNFVKIHSAIKTAPAVAAGVETKPWTVAELLDRCGE